MPTTKNESPMTKAQADRLIELLEDSFILHAIAAKANLDHIRALLRIDKLRVSKVSVMLKSRNKGKG